jgi:hypothetical protein
MSKNALKRHRQLCEQINDDIRREDARILKQCRFFVFVGPVETFRSPRQNKRLPIAFGVGRGQIFQSGLLNSARRIVPTGVN